MNDDASSRATASLHPSVQRYAKHVNPAFVKLLGAFGYGRAFVRARGTLIWDYEGREYLDFLAAFGAHNLGHNPPRLVERLAAALREDLANLVHVGPQVHAGDLAAELAALAPPLEVCLFSSSGGEAVESALKLARAATGRHGVAYAAGGFHGTGLGALSVMGHPRMRAPFEPLLAECHEVPFGDLAALDKVLASRKVGAFLVEPIQAEAGVILPPTGYLRGARELCARRGAVFILDEVQTGLGRAGTMFAYQAEGFVPDALVLGKSLGGGLIAVSATLTSAELHKRAYGSTEKFDLHGSTFSGNALGCVAAMETLAIVRDDKLVEASAARGARLLSGLRAALEGHPLVRDVRGRGLLVAVELGPTQKGLLNRFLPGVVDLVSRRVFGQWLAVRLLERQILCQPATQQWNVLRLEPPLTVTDAEIDRVVSEIASIMGEYRELAPLLADVAQRLGRQIKGGMSFLISLRQTKKDLAFAAGLVRRTPFDCLLQVTNRCNMECSFCDFWPNPAPKKEELTIGEYTDIARQLDRMGTFIVSIEGGEPLIRKDLVDIIRPFGERHIPALFTNGWYITRDNARAMFDAGLVHASVSIDYPDAARHDAKRRLAGATERAWRAVDTLRDAAPRGGKQVHVMTVVMEDNWEDLDALFEQSAAHGVGQQVTLLSLAGPRRSTRGLAMAPGEKGADAMPPPRVAQHLLGLWERHRHVRYFRDYLETMDPFLSGGPMPTCRAGLQSFNIDHVGNVSPCIERIDETVGNVRSDRLADLHARLVARQDEIAGCQRCWTACRGLSQAIGSGGTVRSWLDMGARMRTT